MARQKGLEPLTYCLEGSCSIQLSYCRILNLSFLFTSSQLHYYISEIYFCQHFFESFFKKCIIFPVIFVLYIFTYNRAQILVVTPKALYILFPKAVILLRCWVILTISCLIVNADLRLNIIAVHAKS